VNLTDEVDYIRPPMSHIWVGRLGTPTQWWPADNGEPRVRRDPELFVSDTGTLGVFFQENPESGSSSAERNVWRTAISPPL